MRSSSEPGVQLSHRPSEPLDAATEPSLWTIQAILLITTRSVGMYVRACCTSLSVSSTSAPGPGASFDFNVAFVSWSARAVNAASRLYARVAGWST